MCISGCHSSSSTSFLAPAATALAGGGGWHAHAFVERRYVSPSDATGGWHDHALMGMSSCVLSFSAFAQPCPTGGYGLPNDTPAQVRLLAVRQGFGLTSRNCARQLAGLQQVRRNPA